MTIPQVYQKLHDAYGQQNWWPIVSGTECHYLPGYLTRPRTPGEQFEIAAGAILTQNTAWTNVVKALVRFKAAADLTPRAILEMNQEKLENLIQPAGYYRQKAKKLKILASFVADECHGSLAELAQSHPAESRARLLGLWGIGPETADSILLYALGQPVFVIDAYTRRIGSRLGWYRHDLPYSEMQKQFEKSLKTDVTVFREYHALFVEHAKRFCAVRPRCVECPLRDVCLEVPA